MVRGKLTDFNGAPLENGDVSFQDESFQTLFSTKTDKNGKFEIEIDKITYPSVFICKNYKTQFLEYWHWNFIPKENENLEIKIDGLELYGGNCGWQRKTVTWIQQG